MKFKKAFLFIFCIVSAVVLGSVLADLTKEVPWLTWLSYGTSVGLGSETPAVLDLSVIRLTFAFEMRICIAQVLLIGAAFYLHARLSKKL